MTAKQSCFSPENLRPMLAVSSALPADTDRYGFELKWDGIRALCHIANGKLQIMSRNLLDMTAQYPELKPLGAAFSRYTVLDGEIIAFDAAGRPSFGQLQRRLGVTDPAEIKRRMLISPVVYVIFDILFDSGECLLDLPYVTRRERLSGHRLAGPGWQTPDYYCNAPEVLLAASRRLQLEGIVAKRLDSPYEPGQRSGAWRKIKHVWRQDFVVGGWRPGAGARFGQIGALLIGYYSNLQHHGFTAPAGLTYAGAVGSGFSAPVLSHLSHLLTPLIRLESPFAGRQPKPGAIFVEPKLVVEVEFAEWTAEGNLRHPVFKGIRFDKQPTEVIREQR